ncbi:MAG: hypothetical protein Q9182_003618 [Xanthomendoza sp. 2 TL-2023]
MAFSSIPVLDLSLARNADTKPAFLRYLRSALLEVGFLYIKNTGISDELIDRVITQGKAFFDLREDQKLEVQMKNAPSFLGYNKLGNETTALKTDCFRSTMEPYIRQMSILSTTFISLIAEALLLPPTAFDRFFDPDQQHKLKIIKYPDLSCLLADQQSQQGVGPHKDSMLSSYLLQASHHCGLQAQNLAGEWIDCPPIPGTLVVAIGQGLEALTHGVCASTTHRVLSPAAGQGPRFSIPFFQGVSYDATFESVDIPVEIIEMRRELLDQRGAERSDDVEFTFMKGRWGHLGEATLVNRVKSHPDVGERWYPEILARVREEQRVARERKEEVKERVRKGKGFDGVGSLLEGKEVVG